MHLQSSLQTSAVLSAMLVACLEFLTSGCQSILSVVCEESPLLYEDFVSHLGNFFESETYLQMLMHTIIEKHLLKRQCCENKCHLRTFWKWG